MKDLTAEEFEKLKKEKSTSYILIDVREEWEFEEYNIGGKLMPLNSLPDRYSELEVYADRQIIVHCQSGKRSNQAKIFLSRRGLNNVCSLIGGVEAYKTLIS